MTVGSVLATWDFVICKNNHKSFLTNSDRSWFINKLLLFLQKIQFQIKQFKINTIGE